MRTLSLVEMNEVVGAALADIGPESHQYDVETSDGTHITSQGHLENAGSDVGEYTFLNGFSIFSIDGFPSYILIENTDGFSFLSIDRFSSDFFDENISGLENGYSSEFLDEITNGLENVSSNEFLDKNTSVPANENTSLVQIEVSENNDKISATISSGEIPVTPSTTMQALVTANVLLDGSNESSIIGTIGADTQLTSNSNINTSATLTFPLDGSNPPFITATAGVEFPVTSDTTISALVTRTFSLGDSNDSSTTETIRLDTKVKPDVSLGVYISNTDSQEKSNVSGGFEVNFSF